MKCSDCKHWGETQFSIDLNTPKSWWGKSYDPNYRKGICVDITSHIEIEVNAGWDGGTVGDIETEGKFFCAGFTPKSPAPSAEVK